MDTRRLDAALALGVVALAGLLALLLAPAQPDAAYVGYRYARHFATGAGFAYNLNGGGHLAVAPLWVLALAGASKLIPNPPALGVVFSALCVAGGGLLLLTAGGDSRDRVETTFAALAYVAFPLWWPEAGRETALFALLALAAVLIQARDKTIFAAGLAGLALLVRPVGLLLGLLLLGDTALNGRRVPWREMVMLACCALAWVGMAAWAFGLPFPPRVIFGSAPAGSLLAAQALTSRALAGLVPLFGALLAQSFVWAGVLLLGGAGFARLFKHWWLVLLLVWAVINALSLDVLRVPPTRGDFAPLVPVLAALVGAGVAFARERLAGAVSQRVVLGGAALLLAGAALPSLWAVRQAPARDDAFFTAHGPALLNDTPREAYRQAGEWLADNASPGAVVASAHTGQLGYYADLEALDTGLAPHALARDATMRGDAFWYLPHFAPDYAVISRTSLRERGGYKPLDDAWFAASYAEVTRFGDATTLGGPLAVYERRGQPNLLDEDDELEVDARFAGGLRLAGVATGLSLDPIQPDQLALLRLEWVVSRAQPEEQFLAVRLAGAAGLSAGQTSQVALTGRWPPGQRVTTYHTLETPSALAPGLYHLEVGVGVAAEDIEWQPVLQGKVALGEELFGGGLTGGGGRWPGLIALRGIRLNRTEDALGVGLAWEALADLDEDYTLRLELRDDAGTVVATVEGPPRENAYPTSIWDEGETVPDEHFFDLADVPPGQYALFVSWLDAGGRPLPAEGGEDALEVGRAFVE